ncbi:dihydrofolate reductase family protein [Aggregatilinea lenta]|uniref:dihydrofolate reductase family protein n=1 Tax=Aggregatilinea lenta TaxID=913108 RepID=UPI000E5A9679|nr:dihydrofolate reductase family protein [Aggregatilinea lenta]
MSKPKVVVVQAASVDGRLTLSPDTLLMAAMDRWTAVAGTSETFVNTLKDIHQPQAQLEGSGSFILDSMTSEPLPPAEDDLSALYDDFLPDEIVRQPGRRWFTAVDSRGRIRWMYKEFPGEEWTSWYALVLVSRQTPPAYLAYLRREMIPYLVTGEDRVDLACALDKLNALLDVTTVMSTAGGTLNGALLRAGLIDEVNIDVFPGLIGGRTTPSLFDSTELGPDDQPTRLTLISAEAQPDGHVWLRYAVAAG